ncbi:MAG: single-stranded DNA-binding protein [Microbacterium sp.]|uniref:single-stranded DNA-binding protein n=1 Tax=Microbacterium sp. TaxID=51671 RepID=UPI003A886BAA
MSESITVVGNITAPELKVTADGVEILNFRIASTERRYDKAEETWMDGVTSWYSVSAFRRLADHGHRSFRKGDRVMVSGRLRMRSWETPTKKGVTAEIDADMLGHDLLWGTTTFHRDGGPSRPASESEPTDSPWAVPGAESGPVVDEWETTGPGGDEAAAVADEEAQPRVLVAAAAPF